MIKREIFPNLPPIEGLHCLYGKVTLYHRDNHGHHWGISPHKGEISCNIENITITREVNSNSFDRALDNGPLTDRKIDKYAREGHYGPEIQKRWLAALEAKRARRKPKPKP